MPKKLAYQIQKGDNPALIAQKLYGDQRLFNIIQRELGGAMLTPGMKLKLPDLRRYQQGLKKAGQQHLVTFGEAEAAGLGGQSPSAGSSTASVTPPVYAQTTGVPPVGYGPTTTTQTPPVTAAPLPQNYLNYSNLAAKKVAAPKPLDASGAYTGRNLPTYQPVARPLVRGRGQPNRSPQIINRKTPALPLVALTNDVGAAYPGMPYVQANQPGLPFASGPAVRPTYLDENGNFRVTQGGDSINYAAFAAREGIAAAQAAYLANLPKRSVKPEPVQWGTYYPDPWQWLQTQPPPPVVGTPGTGGAGGYYPGGGGGGGGGQPRFGGGRGAIGSRYRPASYAQASNLPQGGRNPTRDLFNPSRTGLVTWRL